MGTFWPIFTQFTHFKHPIQLDLMHKMAVAMVTYSYGIPNAEIVAMVVHGYHGNEETDAKLHETPFSWAGL